MASDRLSSLPFQYLSLPDIEGSMKRQIYWAIVSATLVIGTVSFSQEQPANKPASDSSNHSADEGKKVFTQRCAACHKTDSETKTIGPGLKGLGGSSRKF